MPHTPTPIRTKSRAEIQEFLTILHGYRQDAIAAGEPPITRQLHYYCEALEWVLDIDIDPLDEFLRVTIGDLAP